MTTLLTFRENIKAFFSRYDYVITPILKFVLAAVIFFTLNGQFGRFAPLNKGWLLLALAAVCAMLPSEMVTVLGGGMIILQSVPVALDVALLSLAFIVIFYFGYMRFATRTGIIVLLIPIFYACHLTCAIPIVMGFMVGPAAIVPVIFGVILYYYEGCLRDLANLLVTATDEEEAIQGYHYVMTCLMENKLMQLTILVFSCVIIVTYIIYRMSFEYSWIVAFVVGGILTVVLFLVGGVTMSMNVDTGSIVLGSLVGIVVSLAIQFAKGIVDYQKTELLQFEDDEYYYYVKAIPKLTISESNKNVKHINSKTQ